MKSWDNLSDLQLSLSKGQYLGLTIGNFDGVHFGHKTLLQEFIQDCKNYNLQSLVLTFDPHPKNIILPRDPYANRLFSIIDLKEQMGDIGLDHLWIQNFNSEIAQLQPDEFIEQFLKPLPIKYLLVGHDFRFGKERKGQIDDLLMWCKKQKIIIKVFSPFELDNDRVSTSLVKKALLEGDLQRVKKYLGRRYYVVGFVAHGENRGEEIGFPTANLNISVPLKNGVYATQLTVDGKTYASITNVGLRPTVNQNLDLWNKNIETHILNQKLDLYGKEIKVEFLQFLRDEKKFNSLEELKTQIQKDILNLKKLSF